MDGLDGWYCGWGMLISSKKEKEVCCFLPFFLGLSSSQQLIVMVEKKLGNFGRNEGEKNEMKKTTAPVLDAGGCCLYARRGGQERVLSFTDMPLLM